MAELTATKLLPSSTEQIKQWVAPIDRAIAEAELQPPFFSMGEQAVEKELRTSIGKVAAMHGIKDYPSREELLLIKRMIFLTFKYNRLNPAQFDQAFEFNLAGEFEETVKPFGIFSIEFMCTVLNYYTHRRDISVKERPKQLPPHITPTPEQMAANGLKFKETVLRYFTRFCEDEQCLFVNPTDVFLFLEKEGLINEPLAGKTEIFEQARKQHMRDLELLDKRDPRNVAATINNLVTKLKAGMYPESEKGAIIYIAREITLRKWFKKWKDAGFDLTGSLFTTRQGTIL